jgi:large subunit ribosomal protein L17
MANMVKNLFKYQAIKTTVARAKETKRLAERLITISKDDTVFARRRVYSVLGDRDLVWKLFKEIQPLFKARSSGFTRIIPIGFRRGDGASLCILELTEKKIVEKLPKKKKEKALQAQKGDETQSSKEAKTSKEEHKKEIKAEETKQKHISKSKPSLQEEKRAEKAKSEDKKASDQRGFMKNIRGLFRKRGDR